MHVLANLSGVPVFGLLIDVGALVSLFAGTLGCVTAAARVLLLMAHHGLAHRRSARPTFAMKPPATRSSSLASPLCFPWPCSRRAERVDWMCTAGWVRWPPTGSLWLTRLVCVRAAALLTPKGRFSAERRDYSRPGLRCHAVGTGGKSLSCAGRKLRKAALHLPGVPRGSTVVVLSARAQRRKGRNDLRKTKAVPPHRVAPPAATRCRAQ
jgi:hypothetical protein